MDQTGPILALDVGEKRIGVAVSDELQIIGHPLTVILRTRLDADIAAIQRIVEARGTTRIIVGLPLSLSGHAGPQAQRAAAFAHTLATRLPVPVAFQDERLSTVEALQLRPETGHRKRKPSLGIDAIAAALILQRYLDGLHGPQPAGNAPERDA